MLSVINAIHNQKSNSIPSPSLSPSLSVIIRWLSAALWTIRIHGGCRNSLSFSVFAFLLQWRCRAVNDLITRCLSKQSHFVYWHGCYFFASYVRSFGGSDCSLVARDGGGSGSSSGVFDCMIKFVSSSSSIKYDFSICDIFISSLMCTNGVHCNPNL